MSKKIKNKKLAIIFLIVILCFSYITVSLDRPESKIVNNDADNLEGFLNINIEKKEGEKWIYYQGVISDPPFGNPRIILGDGGILKLDEIFNPNQVKIFEHGDYRVVAELKDENDNVIQTLNGELRASWEFSIKGGTCSEQNGAICEEGEICPGIQLITLNPEEKCCSEPCVMPSWEFCSECGKGLFNVCDTKECNSIKENCYFEDWRNCISCDAMVCDRYLDEYDCDVDKCNLDCVWDGYICIPKPKIELCEDKGGFCSSIIINPGQGGALINGECPLDKKYCILCLPGYKKDPTKDACILIPKEPIPEPPKPPEEKLKGDFNNDGCVNKGDKDLFDPNYGKEVTELTKKYDLNNDGKINFSDFILFSAQYGKCI